MIGKKAGTGSTVMMIGFSLLLVVVIIGVLVPMIKNAGDSQLMQLDELQGQATDASPEFKYHDKLPTEIRTKFELLVKSFYVTDDSYGLVKIPFIAEDDKFFGKEEPNIGKYTLYIIPAPSGGGIVFLLMVEDKKSTQMADGQRAALAIAPGKELCVVGHEAKSFKPIREYTNIVKNSWRDIYPTTLSASEEMWPETEKVSQIIWEENGNRNKIKAEFKKGEKEQDFVYIPKPKDGNGQTNLFLWNHENKRCFVLEGKLNDQRQDMLDLEKKLKDKGSIVSNPFLPNCAFATCEDFSFKSDKECIDNACNRLCDAVYTENYVFGPTGEQKGTIFCKPRT